MLRLPVRAHHSRYQALLWPFRSDTVAAACCTQSLLFAPCDANRFFYHPSPPRTALNLWFTHIHSNLPTASSETFSFFGFGLFLTAPNKSAKRFRGGCNPELAGSVGNLKCPAETIVHNISPRLCMSLATQAPPWCFWLLVNPTTWVAHCFLNGSAGIALLLASLTGLQGPKNAGTCLHFGFHVQNSSKLPMNAYGGVCAVKYAYAHALSKFVEK